MDNILIIILIFVLIFLIYIVYIGKGSNNTKSTYLKKSQIEQKYVDELKSILNNCSSKDEQISMKKQYMQKVSSELSRNIYFEPHESKQLLQKLASL